MDSKLRQAFIADLFDTIEAFDNAKTDEQREFLVAHCKRMGELVDIAKRRTYEQKVIDSAKSKIYKRNAGIYD